MRFLTPAILKKLRGCTVLLRTDFNVENSKDSLRLHASLPTLSLLEKAGTRIVILSHRGRPKRKYPIGSVKIKIDREETLKIALPFLRKHLHTRVTFIPHFDFQKIRARIREAPLPSVFLIENLRLLAGEDEEDIALGKAIASLGDVYINDAFAVTHRAHASVTQIPKHLESYAGLLLAKEIRTLGSLLRRPEKPLAVILGGAKASDKLDVLEHFLPHASAILLGGVPANTFLKARGFDIGRSVFEPDMLPRARRLLSHKHITLPIDFVSNNNQLLDIGPETVRLFAERLKHAKTILWSGPLGLFEKLRFSEGSKEIARCIARGNAHSIAGGGETTTLIRSMGLVPKFSFLSTGGGAMLEFLAGKKLPGIEALER